MTDPIAQEGQAAGALGLIAGSGQLPVLVAQGAQQAGRPVVVVALEGFANPDAYAGLPLLRCRLGGAASALEWLQAHRVTQVVMAGAVRRPSLLDLRPDWLTAKFLAGIGWRALGDNSLLGAIRRAFEAHGFTVLGADQVIDHLLTPAGLLGRVAPDAAQMEEIQRGKAAALALGAADIGQAVLVQQGMILAAEAIEGTDAMLARSAGLIRPGPRPVLVKMRKPGQDRRLDLPTLGLQTVQGATSLGLAGIAAEAGGSLLIDRPAMVAAADAAGLFLIGIAP